MNNPIYSIKTECSGCRACVEICPRKCIKMIKDEEGFVYPLIDENSCVNCHRCENVCPQKKCIYNEIKDAVVGVHTKEEVFKSASGGAFWALCQILMPQGYVVAGVQWDNNFKVVHNIAYTQDEAQAFRKSKYVMSDTNGIYSKVKKILKDGHKVMFTGSPCEVAACKQYIGDNENLLLVDLICHGAPNQDVFNKEIEYIENKFNGRLQSFEFKQKAPVNGIVNSRSARYIVDGKEHIVCIQDDPFLKGYYSRLFYRPSCGTCHFARPQRVGDITIADAWGVNKIYPQYNDLSGTSLILFNTLKGVSVKESLSKIMNLHLVSKEWAVSSNMQLCKPTSMHKKRDVFFDNLKTVGLENSVELALKVPLWNRMRNFLKKKCRI